MDSFDEFKAASVQGLDRFAALFASAPDGLTLYHVTVDIYGNAYDPEAVRFVNHPSADASLYDDPARWVDVAVDWSGQPQARSLGDMGILYYGNHHLTFEAEADAIAYSAWADGKFPNRAAQSLFADDDLDDEQLRYETETGINDLSDDREALASAGIEEEP